ncbi:MAG: hypothetical protein PVJ09_03655 [Candidatus Woesebacteria bacterium]|jgi:dienelactone hydrolase
MSRQSFIRYLVVILITTAIIAPLSILLSKKIDFNQADPFTNPFVDQAKQKELPLLQYSIPNLKKRAYYPSQIKIESLIDEFEEYNAYLFSYTTMNKKMTGQLNIPHTAYTKNKSAVIIMLRGYVPKEIYQSGVGTKNAAAVLAKNGYITLAPDFFGFGDSAEEPEDSWEGRFIKPINVIELVETVKQNPKIKIPEDLAATDTAKESVKTDSETEAEQEEDESEKTGPSIKLDPQKIGIWAHSNGGQIALTTLEVLSEEIPTTLWAPVTAPFPYSILFFSDEVEDEGKESRAWVALFEKDYDVFDFSLTQHLDKLTGPLQIHHGTSDDAALIAWSDEFVSKIKKENQRRKELSAESKMQNSDSKQKEKTDEDQEEIELPLNQIQVTYHRYPGANHNLQPAWDTAVKRDLDFFAENL